MGLVAATTRDSGMCEPSMWRAYSARGSVKRHMTARTVARFGQRPRERSGEIYAFIASSSDLPRECRVTERAQPILAAAANM